MIDWNKCRETFATFFGHIEVAEMVNLEIPVPDADWHYTATLADDESLQLVIAGKDIVRDSDKTTWIYFDPHDARKLAALLLGFADAIEAGEHRT